MTTSLINGSGGTSSTEQYLFQALQKAMARRAEGQDDADSQSLLAATSTPDLSAASGTGTSAAGSTGHHHRHGHGGGGMFQKIEAAVTSALQSAEDDGSGQDIDQVIQDAIEKVLKEGPGAPGTATGTGSPPPPPPDGAPPADGDQGASAQGGSDRPAFLQLLGSYGVDRQQFFQDLQAAIQKAKEGQATGAAGTAFCPGTVGVDVTG